MKQAPGPKGLPLIGNALAMRGADPLDFWRDAHANYGDTIKMKIGPMDLWFFASPQAIYEVFVTHNRAMRKGLAYAGLKKLLGEGLITTDRDHWAVHRQRLNPVFTPGSVDEYSRAVLDACISGIHELQVLASDKQPVDISHAMMRLTMRVISRTAFGVDLGEGHDEIVDAFEYAFAFVADITAQPIRPPLFVPTPSNRKFKHHRDVINRFVDQLIARTDSTTVASSMSSQIFNKLQDIDRKLLRDEILGIYFAGFETTARTMTFMMDLLARNPAVLKKLRSEANTLDISGDISPVPERLPFATEIVNEALRLYPPVAMMARQTNTDCEIDGYAIKANSMIVVCPFIAQRSKEHWKAGDEFSPETGKTLNKRITHRGAFAPFGAGPRMCLGKHFAMVELALAISLIAREFDWSLEKTAPIELAFHGTLRPREPVMVHLAQRQS